MLRKGKSHGIAASRIGPSGQLPITVRCDLAIKVPAVARNQRHVGFGHIDESTFDLVPLARDAQPIPRRVHLNLVSDEFSRRILSVTWAYGDDD